MRLPSRQLLRTAFAVGVVGAYALPLMVGTASQVSHEVDHLVSQLRGEELRAGVGIGRDAAAPADEFVHAHGDEAAHAHEGGIAMLLVAAEHSEEQRSASAVVALELVGHVPAAGAPVLVLGEGATSSTAVPSAPAADVSLRPPLPPPRA